MKILHVAETIRGGIATYFNELHPLQIAAYGAANVHYVIPTDHQGDLRGVDAAQVSGFIRSGRDLTSMMRMVGAVLGALRHVKPDVVHLHSSFAGMVLRPLLKLAAPGTKVVYCPHGWAFSRETSAASHRIAKGTERVLARLSDRIVCISASEYDAAAAAGIPRGKLALVRSGIHTDRPPRHPAEWDETRLRVLFIGRLDRQKGYDVLIEAARQLVDVAHLRMIGSAVVGEEQELDLPDNVELLGWQDRTAIEAQLDVCDITVVPSRWEGFGLVALEAMRARKPVIAFQIGALPEIIEDGKTGFICTPSASAEALAEVIRKSVDAPLTAMGENGYARLVQHFSIEQLHRRLDAVYAETLALTADGKERQLSSVK